MLPGPYTPTISEAIVTPEYDSVPDAHRVLPKYNNLGSVLLNKSDSDGTRPQERLRLGVSDREFRKMLKMATVLASGSLPGV